MANVDVVGIVNLFERLCRKAPGERRERERAENNYVCKLMERSTRGTDHLCDMIAIIVNC